LSNPEDWILRYLTTYIYFFNLLFLLQP